MHYNKAISASQGVFTKWCILYIMQKKNWLLIFFVCFFLLPSSTFADTIVEGNAVSSSTVSTSISGNGTTTTHIESSVNGVTKTLDSNQPGTYTLTNDGSTTTPTISPTITPTDKPTATPSTLPKYVQKSIAMPAKIEQLFHKAIQKLLSFFHL